MAAPGTGRAARATTGLQPLLKSPAVQRSDYVPTDADLILSDEGQRWLEQPVGGGEDVPQDPRVIEHRRGVPATVTRLQADPVQVLQITIPVRANSGLQHIPQPTPDLSHLLDAPRAVLAGQHAAQGLPWQAGPKWPSVHVPPSLSVSSKQASQTPLSSTFTTAAS